MHNAPQWLDYIQELVPQAPYRRFPAANWAIFLLHTTKTALFTGGKRTKPANLTPSLQA
jgi:hypothetical protein